MGSKFEELLQLGIKAAENKKNTTSTYDPETNTRTYSGPLAENYVALANRDRARMIAARENSVSAGDAVRARNLAIELILNGYNKDSQEYRDIESAIGGFTPYDQNKIDSVANLSTLLDQGFTPGSQRFLVESKKVGLSDDQLKTLVDSYQYRKLAEETARQSEAYKSQGLWDRVKEVAKGIDTGAGNAFLANMSGLAASFAGKESLPNDIAMALSLALNKNDNVSAGQALKMLDRQGGNRIMSGLSGTAEKIWDSIGSVVNRLGGNVDTENDVFSKWNRREQERLQASSAALNEAAPDWDNPVDRWRDSRVAIQQEQQQLKDQRYSGSKVASAVDKYATMAWSQAPTMMMSVMMAVAGNPVGAAETIAGGMAPATTEGLTFISALENSSKMKQLAMLTGNAIGDLAQDPNFWYSYAQEAGSAYNEAINEGVDPAVARLYSSVYGAFSGAIEIKGVFGDFAEGGVQSLPKMVREALASGNKSRAAWAMVASILGEIGEEEAQDAVSKILKMGYREDIPLYSDNKTTITNDFRKIETPDGVANEDAIINPGRMLETMKDTAITTALMGGTERAMMGGVQKVADSKAYTGKPSVLIEQAKRAADDKQVKTIAKIEAAVASRKSGTLTTGEARQLYTIIENAGKTEEYIAAAKKDSASDALTYVFGDKISDADREILADGYDSRLGSLAEYATGARTAYSLGQKGWTFEQVQKHGGEDVAKLSETQLRHAWQLGANAQTAEAVTVDTTTKEGKTALEAKFAPLGAYADMAVNAYEAGQDTSTYSSAMTKAATLYSLGADVDNIVRQARLGYAVDNMAKLTDAQVTVAKQIGDKIRADNIKAVEAKETLLSELRTNAKGKSPTPGKVTIETTSGNAAGLKYNAVDASKLSDTQQGVVRLADAIARYSGLDIHVVDFGKGYGGEYLTGKGGKLYLNINASWNGQNVAVGSLTHEVTHFLQEYAPKRYAELKKIVLEEMSKNPEAFADILGKRSGAQPDLTISGITDEMVANACQTIFMDPEAIQRIATKDPSFFEKLRDWVLKVIDDLKAAFAEFHTDSSFPLMKEVKAAEGALDKMREAWLSAFSEASENLQAEKATGDIAWREAREVFTEHPTEVGTYDMEDFTEAKTPDGEELFQIYAFEHDEPEYREMLAKWGGLKPKEIDELFRTVDMAMAKIKTNLEALDFAWEEDINDRAFQPIKQNSDKLYKVSQDFSTLCRKRLLQGLIAGHLSAALQRGLTKEEGIAVRDALLAIQEEGKQIEVACALCYVESARMRSQKAIQEFLNDREAALRNYYANQKGRDAVAAAEAAERQAIYEEYGLVRGKGDDATMYDIRDAKTAKMSRIPTNLKKRIQDAKKAARSSYALTPEQQRTVDYANSLPVEAFTTPEGLQDLAKSKYRDVFNAFVLKVSAASKSKGIENDTWWRAGDSKGVGDALIEQMNAENGLRTQSWSDFTVKHLMDYIAATIEMSTRGAKQHAYTKVIDYVELMGLTGVMINMSLIPTREFNGKLEYDDVEGFKYKEALRLRNKFPDTAGTICIGMEVEQIRQLLESIVIDYVIPYHQSGMSKDTRKAMHIPAWKDFQNFQGEKQLSGRAAEENARKYGVTLLSVSDPHWHEGPNFSDWFDLKRARQIAKQVGKTGKYGVMTGGYAAMQDAAENYKRICAQRGLQPKFSYGDADFSNDPNYWKLLIDRKMVNNKTGDIIEQKTLKPIFEFETVERILNDELKRYGTVKADQEEAIARVTRAFLAGDIREGMSSTEIAKVMQKPVDNIPITNITQNVQHQKWDDMTPEEQERTIRENRAFNQAQTKTGSLLKTLKGSDISRGGTINKVQYPVGKVISSRLYIHKDYLKTAFEANPAFETAYKKAVKALSEVYPDFQYNCINYHPASGEIQFQEAPGFDTEREPVVGQQVNVTADGGVSAIKNFGQIWHHKWQWVGNDYGERGGFDVRESWEWSREWLSTILGASKGGSLKAWNAQLAENNLPADTAYKPQFQLLDPVPPVQPTSDLWQRTHTEPEALAIYPDMWDSEKAKQKETPEEKRKRDSSQRASTVSTYRKIYNVMKMDGITGKILDASSGLGLGTELGRSAEFGYDVEDIEPFPDASYVPMYKDYNTLTGQYDAIISSAVLNVVAQDQRDALVLKMGSLLKPGGKIYITTRKTTGDVDKLGENPANVQLGPHEFVETVHNHYQKGFTNEELKAYLEDALGDDFTVEIATGKRKFNNNTAVIVTKKGGAQYQTFLGYDEDTGRGIYMSNFPENYPAAEKARHVIELVQNVFSKKPIELVVYNEDGTHEVIEAQFDPDFDETGERKTDLGKLAFGNRKGNRKERRVTLNLADDYYKILQDARYIESGENYADVSESNKDVEIWHYFVNQIFYMDQGKDEKTPYSVYIDVKKKPDGHYVYTFYAREDNENGQPTPLHVAAGVNSPETGTADGSPTDMVPDTGKDVKALKQAWDEGELYNSRALVSEETIDKWLTGGWFGSNTNPNYAQAYIAYMTPAQYLRLSTIYDEGRIRQESDGRTMNWVKDISEGQPIQLKIDTAEGKVYDHEGRHRMVVLERNGVRHVPVLLFDMDTKYSKEPMAELKLEGQNFNGMRNYAATTVKDLVPLNRAHRDEIIAKFSKKTSFERISEEYDKYKTAQFQKWDTTNDDTATERNGRQLAYARLQSENAILSETVKELKRMTGKQKTTLANIQKQLSLTKSPETRLSDARKLARAIVDETGSTANVGQVAEQIKALGDYLLNEQVAEDELKGRARAIAHTVLESASENVTLDEDTLEVNPYEAYMGEASEDLANRIVMDAMRGVLRPTAPTKADKAQARTQALKDHILQLKAENKLSQKEAASLYQTIYDLSVALDKAESRYKTLRTEADYRAAQVRAEGAARAAEIYAKERARSEGLLKAQKEYYQDMAKRAQERRNENAGVTKYRKQVETKAKKLYEMLMTNSNDLHVPEVLKAPLGEFLESLDFTSKRQLAGGAETKADQKFGARLLRIQQMLENQQRYIDGDGSVTSDLGGYIDVSPEILEYLRNMAEMITTAMNMGRTFTVNSMSAADLKVMSQFLSNLRTAIKNMNNFMANARYESVREAANKDIDDMKAMGRAKAFDNSGVAAFTAWQNGTPYYVMKRLGQGARSIFDGLTKGWEKMAFNGQEIIDFAEKAYTTKEVNEWKNKVHSITLEDGPKIQMTTAQIMSFAMLLGREQALKHISKGGVRIGDIKRKAGKVSDTKHYHLTDGDIKKITGLLNGRQMAVAKALQKYMAVKGAEWGNEISMRRFGYNFYTEGDAYFPIQTDSNDRPMADTDLQTNSMFRLLNLSASKSLNPKASNALVVNDIFDVFADHMADMAKLNGMGLAILDAIKWFNYKEKIKHDDGTYDTKTLQGAMQQAFGDYAGRYFRTMMKDINGQTESGDRGMGVAGWFISRYKAASVGANLRVALLQPTSYVRAMTVVKPQYLIGAFAHKNAYKEAMKYSGTAVWKSLGFYETDMARSMREQIQHDEGLHDKLVEASMKLAELGDRVTWGRLWVACKMQTKAETGLSGEALNQKTADLFREAIYSSQVMDSTLTRSEIMRSKGTFSKLSSAFMAEPTLSYNILLDAASQLSLDERRYGKAQAWKKNAGKIGRAFTVYVNSAVFAAIVESLADAARDDDDEPYWDKVLQAFFGEDGKILTGNLAQDLTILGKLPYIKDFISKLQGYQNNNLAISAFNTLVDAFKIWEETYKLSTGELEKPTKITGYGKMTEWGKIYKTLQAVSQLSGVAMSNMSRDAVAIWNTIMNGRKDEWKIKTYEDSNTEKAANLIKAIESGYEAKIETRMQAFDDEKEAESAVKAYLKDQYNDEKITEEKATELLARFGIEGDDAYWLIRNWEGEDKYTEIKAAVLAGDKATVQSELKQLTEHGVKEKDVLSSVKSFVKKIYMGEDLSEKESQIVGDLTLSAADVRKILHDYAGLDTDKAVETVAGWDFKKQYGFDYSNRKEAYMDGTITSAQLRKILTGYGGKSAEDADSIIKSYDFEKQHGWAWGDRKELYQKGKVSRTEMLKLLQSYGEMTPQKAADQLTVWDWSKDIPGAENITISAVEKYNENCAALGVDKGVFVQAWKGYNDTKADIDANGDSVAYSKTVKVMPQINALPISAAQKTAIALCFWSQSTVNKYKLW